MPGTPKRSPKSKKAKSTGTKKSSSTTGFPVGRIGSMLRKGSYHRRVGAAAPVYVAAVLEFVTAELLESAATSAQENGSKRITPRAIQLAVSADDELKELFSDVTIASGGVAPNLKEELTVKPKKASKKRKSKKE